ncbi:MAG: hypothetical protein OXC13_07710 [Caldilineaceae bacterium]|nr:hypothetical protein [Caldilineaceae bacterium]
MTRSGSHIQQGIAIGTGRKQSPCHVHTTRSDSRVQRGLPIFPLHVNWDTDRQQYLGNTDVPFDSCRVQQGLAVGTGSDQKLGDIGMS